MYINTVKQPRSSHGAITLKCDILRFCRRHSLEVALTKKKQKKKQKKEQAICQVFTHRHVH